VLQAATGHSRIAWRFFIAAFVALCAASFALALFVPIYSDEIVWKAMQGRMGYDHFHNAGNLLNCPIHEIPTPLLLRPFYLVDTALYQDLPHPLLLRVMGAGLALAWGVTAWTLLKRLLAPTIPPGIVALLILAFSTLGIMPFLLALNRPEQPLLIAVTALVIPLLADPARPRRALWADIAVAGALAAACGYVLASHPRGLMAAPLMLLFIACFVSRRSLAAVCCAAILVIAKVALDNWGTRPLCMDPRLRLQNILDNIVLAVREHELGYYMSVLLKKLPHPDFFYLTQFQLKRDYTSHLIPGASIEVEHTIGLVTALAFAFLLILGVASFVIAARRYLKTRQGLVPLAALGLVWAICFFSMIARTTKATYEASFMEPILVLASLLSLWLARDPIMAWIGAARTARLARLALGCLIVLSAANQIALLATYIPHARGSWTDPGYPKGQPFSISAFGFGAMQEKIRKTAALCGIDPEKNPNRLVVDELTFFPMKKAYAPFFGTYIDQRSWGKSVTDIRGSLTRWRSDGMILGCQWVPPSLRQAAIRNGPFCCLPAFRPAGGAR
jgi:hypothetical protein